MAHGISVVIPVKDGGELVARCVSSIVVQLQPGDELLVVDDGSSDGATNVAERLGATVIRSGGGLGPYGARNLGWREGANSIIAFTDMRCTARSSWLETMRGCFIDEQVAMACATVAVHGGSTLAENAMALRQSFSVKLNFDRSWFLPFFPTCNLSVRKHVLEALNGFCAVPSGGDTDFCWRAQLAGYTGFAAIDEVVMDWSPRGTLPDFVRQWRKYGVSTAELQRAYKSYGAAQGTLSRWQVLRETATTLGGGLVKHRVRPDIAIVNAYATLVYQRTARRTGRELDSGVRQNRLLTDQ